jgi:predicted nucleotidyltransferase
VATTAPQAFEQFKTRLTLTSSQRAGLRERRDRVKNLLADEWAIETVLFGGSHARGSKIRSVLGRQGDVDVYVVLKSEERKYGGVFGPPPAKLLTDIKQTLDRSLKTPKIRADSPAVRITYDDMIVDVVPAFPRFLSDALDIPYYKTWMTATPRGQQRVFKELDDARQGRFKPLLRMLKHWKAVHHTIGLRSYHLETLAYEIFRKHAIDDYRVALHTFFDEARGGVQYHWNDPGGSGNLVSDYLTTSTANLATQMFTRAAERAARAIDAPTWRQEIAIWRSPLLLGSRFPAYTGS